jgi:hypothetical protein
MMIGMRWTRWVGAFLVLGLALGGCKGDSPRFTDAQPIDAMASDGGVDDAPTDAPIDGPPANGQPGTATVSGAVKASSPGYRLFGTLRSGDGSSTSPGYHRRGGVTGATQP